LDSLVVSASNPVNFTLRRLFRKLTLAGSSHPFFWAGVATGVGLEVDCRWMEGMTRESMLRMVV
jgi:hypothetical protein